MTKNKFLLSHLYLFHIRMRNATFVAFCIMMLQRYFLLIIYTKDCSFNYCSDVGQCQVSLPSILLKEMS